MKIKYEGIRLKINLADEYQCGYLKIYCKNIIKKILGMRIKRDSYLEYAYRKLVNLEHPIIVDVGCNFGTTVLPVAKKFQNASIYAVEAHPVAASRFIENVRLNSLQNVNLIVAAASSHEGMYRIFTEPKNSGGNRVTGFGGRADLASYKNVDDRITIPSLKLESIFKHFNLGTIHLLKIDVEGFEVHVLQSLGDFLSPRIIPNVVCEYGPEGMRAAGVTGDQMLELMLRSGYRCVDLHTKIEIKFPEDIPKLPDLSVTDWLFTEK